MADAIDAVVAAQPESIYDNGIYDRLFVIINALSEVDIANINLERWKFACDTVSITGDIDMDFDQSFAALFDIPSEILSKIPQEELIKPESQTFINEYNMVASDLITDTVSNSLLWQTDLKKKLLWIANMLAVKSCPNVLKYLRSDDFESILELEDSFGCNCFIMACTNIQSLSELITLYGTSYLFKLISKKITPIDLLVHNGGIIQLLMNNKVSIDDVLNYKNEEFVMNVFHIMASSSSTFVVEHLLNTNKVSLTQLESQDKNKNTPLHIALTYKSPNYLHLIKSKIYTTNILTIKNLNGNTILHYISLNPLLINTLLKNGIMTEQIYFANKYYKAIDEYNCISLFKLSFFNENTLTKDISDAAHDGDKILFDMMARNIGILSALLKSEDEKIVEILTKFCDQFPILPYIAFDNEMSIVPFLQSKYVKEHHFRDKYHLKTIFDIACRIHFNTKLIEHIIDCPQLKKEDVPAAFIGGMLQHSSILARMINKRIIDTDMKSFIQRLIDADKIQTIIDLVKDEVINVILFKKYIDLLVVLINRNVFFLEYVMNNDLFNRELLDEIKFADLLAVPYEFSDELFERILKHPVITTILLNTFTTNNRPITNYITRFSQLEILLKTRSDFDQSLFFRKYNDSESFLTDMCDNDNNKYDEKLVVFLLDHPLFTEAMYDNIILNPITSRIITNKDIGEKIIQHKFLNKNILKINTINIKPVIVNVLEYAVYYYSTESTTHLLKQNFITLENLKDRRDNLDDKADVVSPDVFQLAYRLKRYDLVKIMIELPIFDISLITQFDMLQYIEEHPEMYTITKYVEVTKDYNFVTKDNNKILKNLVNTNSAEDSINLINIIGVQCLYESDVLHFFVDEFLTEVITKMLDFLHANNHIHLIMTLKDKNNHTPFMLIMQDGESFTKDEDLVKLIKDYNIPEIINETLDVETIIMISQCKPQFFRLMHDNGINLNNMFKQIDLKTNYPVCFEIAANLDPNLFDEELLLLTYTEKNITLFADLLRHHNEKKIMELIDLNKITNQMILDNLKYIVNNYDLLEYLLSINNYAVIFNQAENILICMNECIKFKLDTMSIITNEEKNKYYKKEYVNLLDENNILNLIRTQSGLKYVLDNNLINESIVSRNDYNMIRQMNNPYNLKKVLDFLNCDVLIRFMHKLAAYPNMITYFLNRFKEPLNDGQDNYSYQNKLLEVDKKKQNIMHILIKNEYYNDILYALKELCITYIKNLMNHKDDKGNTPLMLCFKKLNNRSEKLDQIRELIIKNNLFNTDSLIQTNNKSKSLLSFMTPIIDSSNFKKLVQQVYETYGISHFIENDNDMLQLATIYNSDNLKVLLAIPEIVNEYNNFSKCFALACRHQSKSISPLIATNKIDYNNCYDMIKIENLNDEDQNVKFSCNYLQIACKYNYHSVVELLKLCPQLHLRNALNEENIDNPKIPFNAFVLAIMYEPEIVELLINSTTNIIDDSFINSTNKLLNRNCILFALETQIASATYILKSPLFKNFLIDNVVGSLQTKYMITISKVQPDNPLLKHRDALCNMEDIEACSVCWSHKNCIVLSPCSHKTCVACSLKINVCPQCRSPIEKRLTF